jgi:hypothetical protein
MAFVDLGGPPVPRQPMADLRRGDIALGVFTATFALACMIVGVAFVEVSVLDEPPSFLAPGEIAVAIHPVSSSAVDPSIDTASVEASTTLPSVTLPSSSHGAPGSTLVPPRPADAPAPSASRPERPSGGIRSLPRIDGPKEPSLVGLDDLLGFGRGGPAVAPGDADPAKSPNDPYAYVDPTQKDPAATGQGVVDGDDAGDPLAARALAAYRQRLQGWLSAHFYVTNSGLSKDALRKAKIRATLEITEARIVVGHTIEPGGHPALEAAARRALDRVMGQPVPEPPQHYPGPLQRSISVTFTCTEDTCN